MNTKTIRETGEAERLAAKRAAQAVRGRLVRSACECGACLALLAGASAACGLVYEALALAALGLVPAAVGVYAVARARRGES